MANAYTELGIASDPQDGKQEMVDDLAVRIPGWVSHPGSLADELLEVVALQHARVGAAVEDRMLEVFSAFGNLIVGEPILSEEHATGTVTFTATDSLGVDIPAGTALSGTDGSGGSVIFQTTVDASIPAASTTVASVPVEAIDPGLLPSAVSGVGAMVSYVARIGGVSFDAATTLGADGETLQAYADRLAGLFEILSLSPVTAGDYDLFLRYKLPTVYRVLVRDTYNPADNTSGNRGMLMVSMVDVDGVWVGSTVDAEAVTLVEAAREDIIFNVVAPTVTTVDVHYSIIVQEDYVPADVISIVDDAVATYLSPASWGSNRTGQDPSWILKDALRPFGMIGSVIGACEGVMSVEAVTARVGADPFSASTITLAGDAPLVDLGVIVGTSV